MIVVSFAVEERSLTSLQENKVRFKRFYDEVLNGRNLSLMNEFNASNLVDHNRTNPRTALSDLEAAKDSIAVFHHAFPEIKWTVDDMFAEGDRVVARWTARGTHKGEFMGIPPTGKQVAFSGIEIVRMSRGKAVEHREQLDVIALMQQLGVMPPPS